MNAHTRAYLDTLEPAAATLGENVVATGTTLDAPGLALASIAISLKRIADGLEACMAPAPYGHPGRSFRTTR